MKVKSESEVAQSCLPLSDPMDCSLPGSSVRGIFQARVLEWGAIDTYKIKNPCIVQGYIQYLVKTYNGKESETQRDHTVFNLSTKIPTSA